jgi:hypothetical protein
LCRSGVSGSLPSSLAALSGLRRLSLADNDLDVPPLPPRLVAAWRSGLAFVDLRRNRRTAAPPRGSGPATKVAARTEATGAALPASALSKGKGETSGVPETAAERNGGTSELMAGIVEADLYGNPAALFRKLQHWYGAAVIGAFEVH